MPLTTLTLTTLLATSAPSFTAEPTTLTIGTVTLHGTLDRPTSPGPYPVALIIAGSGPTDRDGNSAALPGRNDSLKALAEDLACQGVATLRYDKRGIGASTTTQQEQDITLDTFVNDATAWLQQLQRDPRFASVSVIGHSEGSLIGMLAAQRTPIRAFISLAGPGENLADTLLRQLRANPNNPADLINDAERILGNLRAGHPTPDVPPLLAPLFRPSVQPYLISILRHDPAQALTRVPARILILQGDRDLQVTPDDARALAAARPDAKLVILPGMNHVLRTVGDDPTLNVRSYTDPSVPLAGDLARHIATFIRGTMTP